MKLGSKQVQGLIKLISVTREKESNCEECLSRVAEHAECFLTGKTIPEALKAVEHHLSLCEECKEEYEVLLELLQALGSHDSMA
ncbi:MAG: hypothetical protein GKR87_14150 [Kiritimatiellae bacterium]|nr:hypothetical protein [Kiritimatiellia bacterium]